jgi:hypothetical protein
LRDRGYRCNPTNPNYYVKEDPWVFLEVHMDDIYGTAVKEHLEDLARA